MGTRSLTFVTKTGTYSDTGKKYKEKYICMYRQYDGYPDGHGQDLIDFLVSGTMVNGLGMNQGEIVFNGTGCLAAQIVANFKEGAGGIYLYPTNTKNAGQDYEYHVNFNADTQKLIVDVRENGYMRGKKYCSGTRSLFKGEPKEFKAWLEMYHEA